jgi:hypothetical protein
MNIQRRIGVISPRIGTKIVLIIVLLSSFVAVVLWFNFVDYYHRHFFDDGPIVVVNNVVRVLFVAVLSWLIYAPGAGIVSLVTPSPLLAKLTSTERAVLCFGIGVGVWHAVMLILGVLNLYFRSAIVGLCLVVLIASSPHFANVAIAGLQRLAIHFVELRQRRASPPTIGAILIAVVAVWLLMRRGLYPGGGGDYYTHYFYYYLEVIKNHGLTPNDVWYHYYYSKGSGLAFLGMLLTDPEAPALTTYVCVVAAAIAIATLAARMAPNSLWPAAGALAYLLYYLLGYAQGNGEAEFQKDHELVATLVVLTTWALCMERTGSPRLFRLMASACAIAASIITPAVGLLLGFFVALLCAWSILHRRWNDVWGYAAVGGSIAIAVFAVFVLNYMSTGLANDQPLGPMLYFADFGRLDQWGVIPQIITIAWIRDNYTVVAPSFGRLIVIVLAQFMRLYGLWPFLLAPVITAVALRSAGLLSLDRRCLLAIAKPTSFAAESAARLTALLLFFVAVALVAGRVQHVSFARLSTFFVPLIVMFGIAGSACILAAQKSGRHHDKWTMIRLPLALLVGLMLSWQLTVPWARRLPGETANVVRFLFGYHSLAKAYEYADSPYSFGAINPGALAAARQLPSGTPIWSTNVDSYCMAPGCLIESVVSFKMSGRLDEILGDDPELAKRRLQEAGLNYFLFMKDYRLLDLLPFSRLFSPEMIGRYLGVKWTDGSTFLLTWIGPETAPIGPDFLDAYTRRRNEFDTTQWFRFNQLAPQIIAISPRLRTATKWGASGNILTWR